MKTHAALFTADGCILRTGGSDRMNTHEIKVSGPCGTHVVLCDAAVIKRDPTNESGDWDVAVFIENTRMWATLASNAFTCPTVAAVCGEGDFRIGSIRVITRPFTHLHGKGLHVFIRTEHAAKRSYKTGVASHLTAGAIWSGDRVFTDSELRFMMSGAALIAAYTHDKELMHFAELLKEKAA